MQFGLTCGLVDMWSDCCVPINLGLNKTQELNIYFHQTLYTETRNIPGLETISYVSKTLMYRVFKNCLETLFEYKQNIALFYLQKHSRTCLCYANVCPCVVAKYVIPSFPSISAQ